MNLVRAGVLTALAIGWIVPALALDIVPDGPPLEQPEVTANEIYACLAAKEASKLPPAALQAAQEECEAKARGLTRKELFAIGNGCIFRADDDQAQSDCFSGTAKLRRMFAVGRVDLPFLTAGELRAMGSGCVWTRNDTDRVRCLVGIGKLNAQSPTGRAEPDVAATGPSAPGHRPLTRADELDDWCAQVKKASSIVICSDPELRQQAIARNKLFEAARTKLRPDEYKALAEDQSRWVKSYTARCGVSLDGPVPSLPLPQGVIDCYRREARARTDGLAERLSRPGTSTTSLPPATIGRTSRPSPNDPAAPAVSTAPPPTRARG
jgi:uncharacterized protein YecT (DUF1311 family)